MKMKMKKTTIAGKILESLNKRRKFIESKISNFEHKLHSKKPVKHGYLELEGAKVKSDKKMEVALMMYNLFNDRKPFGSDYFTKVGYQPSSSNRIAFLSADKHVDPSGKWFITPALFSKMFTGSEKIHKEILETLFKGDNLFRYLDIDKGVDKISVGVSYYSDTDPTIDPDFKYPHPKCTAHSKIDVEVPKEYFVPKDEEIDGWFYLCFIAKGWRKGQTECYMRYGVVASNDDKTKEKIRTETRETFLDVKNPRDDEVVTSCYCEFVKTYDELFDNIKHGSSVYSSYKGNMKDVASKEKLMKSKDHYELWWRQ